MLLGLYTWRNQGGKGMILNGKFLHDTYNYMYMFYQLTWEYFIIISYSIINKHTHTLVPNNLKPMIMRL